MKKFIKRADDAYNIRKDAITLDKKYRIRFPDGEEREYNLSSESNKYLGRTLFFSNVRISSTRYNPHPESYIDRSFKPSVQECVSIPTMYLVDGTIKLIDPDTNEVIPPETYIETVPCYVFDESKLVRGGIYKITIDGNPIFNNTLAMLATCYGMTIEFDYQRKVIYNDQIMKTESARFGISLDGSLNELVDTVHIEEVNTNTNNMEPCPPEEPEYDEDGNELYRRRRIAYDDRTYDLFRAYLEPDVPADANVGGPF